MHLPRDKTSPRRKACCCKFVPLAVVVVVANVVAVDVVNDVLVTPSRGKTCCRKLVPLAGVVVVVAVAVVDDNDVCEFDTLAIVDDENVDVVIFVVVVKE